MKSFHKKYINLLNQHIENTVENDRFGQADKSFTRSREGSEFIIELQVNIVEEKEEEYLLSAQSKVEKINIELSDIYSYNN